MGRPDTYAGRIGLVIGALLMVAVSTASAQDNPRPLRERAGALQGGQAPGPAAREVERLFDAYVAVQAQDALHLADSQLTPFLSKLTALQQVRRRAMAQRRVILNGLSKLLSTDRPDEGKIQEALRRLREHDDQAAAEIQRGYAALDQVLDSTQQARFRVLEDQVERRRIELLIRARRRAALAQGTDPAR